MNIEDIKVGETYNVRVKCLRIDEEGFYGFNMETKPPIYRLFNKKDVESCVFPLTAPANGIKNTETAPKYDPNRKFRKGDKVKLVDRDGRSYIDYDPTTKLREGAFYTVLEDESDVIEGGCPDIRIADEHAEYEVLFYFLELVTPLEEQEPYSVSEATVQYLVKEDNKKVVAQFCKLYHPTAKAAAEAECERLNEEWRKEKE